MYVWFVQWTIRITVGTEDRWFIGSFINRIFFSLSHSLPFSISSLSVVEDLHKQREPLAAMEAIYLMTPTDDSIRILMRDFELNRPMYKAAHVYFSEGTFNNINRSSAYFFFGMNEFFSNSTVTEIRLAQYWFAFICFASNSLAETILDLI